MIQTLRLHRRQILAAAAALPAACAEETPGAAFACAAPDQAEREAMVAGLRHGLRRARPVIAVLASPDGAQTSDVIVPFAILARSGLAEVRLVSPTNELIALMPALTIRPQLDLASFDAAWPEGADLVVVPALHQPADPQIRRWVQHQHGQGALMLGVCAGALVLSAAGLLADRRATTHWWQRGRLRHANPAMSWVPDRRFVLDRGIVTTTGVSATIPISLALVEAMGSASQAAALAAALGLPPWSLAHDSAAFGMTAGTLATVLGRYLRRQSRIGIPVGPGVDEVALALTADAWSSTGRSTAYAIADGGLVRGAAGLDILTTAGGIGDLRRHLPKVAPGLSLDVALDDIAVTFGAATAGLVALSLEYPWGPFERCANPAAPNRR